MTEVVVTKVYPSQVFSDTASISADVPSLSDESIHSKKKFKIICASISCVLFLLFLCCCCISLTSIAIFVPLIVVGKNCNTPLINIKNEYPISDVSSSISISGWFGPMSTLVIKESNRFHLTSIKKSSFGLGVNYLTEHINTQNNVFSYSSNSEVITAEQANEYCLRTDLILEIPSVYSNPILLTIYGTSKVYFLGNFKSLVQIVSVAGFDEHLVIIGNNQIQRMEVYNNNAGRVFLENIIANQFYARVDGPTYGSSYDMNYSLSAMKFTSLSCSNCTLKEESTIVLQSDSSTIHFYELNLMHKLVIYSNNEHQLSSVVRNVWINLAPKVSSKFEITVPNYSTLSLSGLSKYESSEWENSTYRGAVGTIYGDGSIASQYKNSELQIIAKAVMDSNSMIMNNVYVNNFMAIPQSQATSIPLALTLVMLLMILFLLS